jgi:octaprenyl-diphosphate synthase
MSSRLKIFNTIKKELKQFETLFDSYLKGLEFSDYLMDTKGKMLRPALTIIAGNIAGKASEQTYWYAIAVEMMHNATLVHDDIVDDANQRRQKATFRASQGDKKAVLYGDYLFAKSLECVVKTNDFRIIQAIANTTGEMSIGEIKQLDESGGLSTAEKDYYDIIYKKTASLFVCSLMVGHYSTSVDTQWEETIQRIGYNLGMAFQIKDDLLDYNTQSKSGKAFGNDIQEKKMTLPLIYALQQVSEEKEAEIKKMINLSTISDNELLKIINFSYKNEGITYTEGILASFLRKAQEDIDTLPKSMSKDALGYLVTYLAKREK